MKKRQLKDSYALNGRIDTAQAIIEKKVNYLLCAKELLHHARQEWSVETMHWLLDVLFGGDSCRIQTKTAQQNLNMVRKLALNIMRMYKQETKSKIALTALMFKSLLDPYQLLHILGKN